VSRAIECYSVTRCHRLARRRCQFGGYAGMGPRPGLLPVARTIPSVQIDRHGGVWAAHSRAAGVNVHHISQVRGARLAAFLPGRGDTGSPTAPGGLAAYVSQPSQPQTTGFPAAETSHCGVTRLAQQHGATATALE